MSLHTVKVTESCGVGFTIDVAKIPDLPQNFAQLAAEYCDFTAAASLRPSDTATLDLLQLDRDDVYTICHAALTYLLDDEAEDFELYSLWHDPFSLVQDALDHFSSSVYEDDDADYAALSPSGKVLHKFFSLCGSCREHFARIKDTSVSYELGQVRAYIKQRGFTDVIACPR